jgi:hypothetical protein
MSPVRLLTVKPSSTATLANRKSRCIPTFVRNDKKNIFAVGMTKIRARAAMPCELKLPGNLRQLR